MHRGGGALLYMHFERLTENADHVLIHVHAILTMGNHFCNILLNSLSERVSETLNLDLFNVDLTLCAQRGRGGGGITVYAF